MTEDEMRMQRNIERVKGVEVTLRIWLDRPKPKTAKIVSYQPPLIWILDRPLGGSVSHVDSSLSTLDGKALSDYPGLE
jgi:hypothetical protein